jgi:hypothetical protein
MTYEGTRLPLTVEMRIVFRRDRALPACPHTHYVSKGMSLGGGKDDGILWNHQQMYLLMFLQS